jgi:acetyltransferase-like isoleucine patch superfamily enzyme
MARRTTRYPVQPENALTYTYRIVPVWRVAVIFLVQSIARFCPCLPLKNSLYRVLGVKVGNRSRIALGAQLDWLFPQLVTLGENVTVGMDASILTHEFLRQEYRLGKVEIGDDAVIGTRAIILPGVKVGPGAVVGAGAVVTRDVPARTLAVGNPAVHKTLKGELYGELGS